MMIQQAQEPGQVGEQQLRQSGRAQRAHLYELDPLRALTALCVVGVHVVSLTVFLNQAAWGMLVQDALVAALHYTREMFMFVSAFALTYVYYGKPFRVGRFYKKRAIGVLIPYCIWSAIYIRVNLPGLSPGAFLSTTAIAVLNGNASFQLYFILISLEFYVVFPLFMKFMQLVEHHPWKTLAASFILQVVMMSLDFKYLQLGTLASSGFWLFVSQHQDSFFLTYQFYFILGGFAAIYMQQVRSFLLRHGRLLITCFVLALLGLWACFYVQVEYLHISLGYATSVLQPDMVFFSPLMIALLSWVAARWAGRVNAAGYPKGHRFWRTLSDVSFGVYLIHVLILYDLLHMLLPALPGMWPVALRVFVIWLLTAGLSVIASIILMNIPVVSRLVGRERPSKRLEHLKMRISALLRRRPGGGAAFESTSSSGEEDEPGKRPRSPVKPSTKPLHSQGAG